MHLQPRDFDKACALLKLCVGDSAQRELSEYLQNPAVSVFCASDTALCGILIIMIGGECCDILDIAVLPQLQNRKVGTALLEHATEFCREREVCVQLLEVRVSNTGALEFYKKSGFEQISIRKKYYQDPVEDAAILRRYI